MAKLTGDQATPVEDDGRDLLPSGYLLNQNYPNPFNAGTTIEYVIPRRSDVRLAIYNLLGQEVNAWPVESQAAGEHRVQWNGRSKDGNELATGIYFFRLETDEFSAVRKLVLLK
jgi:hypothetical protein